MSGAGAASAAHPPSALGRWWLAIRPKTLWAAVAPVLVGTALAVRDGQFAAPWAVLALGAALCIQIGTNLHNDWEDARRGADTDARTGPVRATQGGLLTPRQVLAGAVVMFALAAALAAIGTWRGGWPMAVVLVASIAAAVGYTGGPRPFGYLGLGELFVLVFFGPVAVAATYYLQALAVSGLVVAIGLGPGLLATAILLVNNLRDRDTDRAAGKLTVAVRFGAGFARTAYVACVAAGIVLPAALLVSAADGPGRWLYALPMLVAAGAWAPLRQVAGGLDGPALNPVLGRTAQLLLMHALLVAVAVLAVHALRT